MLTAIEVKAVKPKEKPYKIGDRRGLYLVVLPTGAKRWRMNYSFRGKAKTFSLGSWPGTSLAEARSKCADAKKLLEAGVDPGEKIKLDRIAASIADANTFGMIAEEWLEKGRKQGNAPVTLKKNEWLLKQVEPALGHRPICEISAAELLMALRKVEARGRYDTANRLRSICGQVFRYGIATARAERDVAADIKGALISHRVTHRAAITNSQELGALLRAIDGFEGQTLTRRALQILPHLFVRPGELRWAEWREFDFEKKVWMIPAAKMKMRRPHMVPLSRQVIELLRKIETDARYSPLLFPSLRSLQRPMSENTINAALRRLGYSKEEMTGHGFRATAATLLNEKGIWHPDAIERQLAHAEANSVRRAYARGEYWDERVRMMQYWSDHLDSLKAGRTGAPSPVTDYGFLRLVGAT
jgi:integrase